MTVLAVNLSREFWESKRKHRILQQWLLKVTSKQTPLQIPFSSGILYLK
jgi:hypothetical protein